MLQAPQWIGRDIEAYASGSQQFKINFLDQNYLWHCIVIECIFLTHYRNGLFIAVWQG